MCTQYNFNSPIGIGILNKFSNSQCIIIVRRQLIKNESIILDGIKPIKKNFARTMIKLFGKLMK